MAAEQYPHPPVRRFFGMASVAVVWLSAFVGAVLIGFYSLPEQRVKWIALTMAACTVAAFGVQLALRHKDGFVDRLGASVAGAIIVLAGATVIFSLNGAVPWEHAG